MQRCRSRGSHAIAAISWGAVPACDLLCIAGMNDPARTTDGMTTTLWSPTAVVARAFGRLKSEPRLLLLFLPYVVARGLPTLVMDVAGDVQIGPVPAGWPVEIAGRLLAAFLHGGVVSMALSLARDEPVRARDIVSGSRFTLAMFVGELLHFLGMALGLVLLVIPGIVFCLSTALWAFCVVDGGLGPVAALQRSSALMNGQKRAMVLLYLCMFTSTWVFCALSLLGDVLFVPLFELALASVYVNLTSLEREIETLPAALPQPS